MKKIDKIILGKKVTSRSSEKLSQYFLQGTEIRDIGISRSGLPILGKNPRYKLVDNSVTGSITDSNYFLDVESSMDAGLGQDIVLNYSQTFFTSPAPYIGLVVNGIFQYPPYADAQMEAKYNNFLAYTSGNSYASTADKNAAWKNYVLTINSFASQADIKTNVTLNGIIYPEVWWQLGTFSVTESADVKFPDGKISETISFSLGQSDYGYGKEYVDSTPFFDLEKYDAVRYIESNGPAGMMPIVGSYISYDEKLSYNGIIEPFAIRSRALGLSIFLENERQPGAVSANVENVATFNYDSRENDIRSEFFEDCHTRGTALSRTEAATLGIDADEHRAISLLEPEFVSNYQNTVYHYVERDTLDLLISDAGIEKVQVGMDPTLDEGILPVTHVDMTTGFDSVSRDRINSIPFRGMLRR